MTSPAGGRFVPVVRAGDGRTFFGHPVGPCSPLLAALQALVWAKSQGLSVTWIEVTPEGQDPSPTDWGAVAIVQAPRPRLRRV